MEKSERLFWILTGSLAAVVGALYLLVLEPQTGPGPAPPGVTGSGAAAGARPSSAEPARLQGNGSSRFSLPAALKRRQVFARVQGDGAFVRLGEPRPGEWLWSFAEPGQTIEELARSEANRRTEKRHTIHLLPFTELEPHQLKMLSPLSRFVALYFQTRVVSLPPRPLRASWYNAGRGQYKAHLIVRQLAGEVPPDSLGLFGILGGDLYVPDLNFVFGLALFHQRASIHSLHRYGSDEEVLLGRALKLTVHELGHVMGLRHCVFYECVMNGVNSLAEGDRKPLHICPVCLAKLCWSLGLDPVRRYRSLAAFYDRVGLQAEASFARARADEAQEL